MVTGREWLVNFYVFFFQAEDGIRDVAVTGVQTCALPILLALVERPHPRAVVALALGSTAPRRRDGCNRRGIARSKSGRQLSTDATQFHNDERPFTPEESRVIPAAFQLPAASGE